MTAELRVHPSFFKEFAMKTWISPYEIVRELIENAFDEDATTVIVTVLSNGDIVIEDNAGMDSVSMDKFLILGSPHKAEEKLSPKLKRIRTGRYGTGRLSFLTSFEKMIIRTRLDDFRKNITIDGHSLEDLISGRATLQESKKPSLERNGTEIVLMGSKINIDLNKLSREIKKLSILKYPLFEVYLKSAERFEEWNLTNSQIIRSPDIQGYRVIVDIDNPKTTGEVIIARRPLGEDEKGIAVMVGNHVVLRSAFGFENKLSRVTGFVKCDSLTSRFADKSALIENDEYDRFNQIMKTFIINHVLPSLTEYEDVLITREESKIYKEIDKVMGQAVLETLEASEEVEGFESVEEISSIPTGMGDLKDSSAERQLDSDSNHYELNAGELSSSTISSSEKALENFDDNPKGYKVQPLDKETTISNSVSLSTENQYAENHGFDKVEGDQQKQTHMEDIDINLSLEQRINKRSIMFEDSKNFNDVYSNRNLEDQNPNVPSLNSSNKANDLNISQFELKQRDAESSDGTHVDALTQENGIVVKKTVRKPVLKKTFTLKRIGYKVIPYEDESDSRYSFTNENIVFVNKAHSTYKAEAQRGDEFLFRHITNIVAEVVVGSKFPESRDVLEIQNKLISEAIKIHDYSVLRK